MSSFDLNYKSADEYNENFAHCFVTTVQDNLFIANTLCNVDLCFMVFYKCYRLNIHEVCNYSS